MKISTGLYCFLLGCAVFLASCGEDDLKKAGSVSPKKITFTRDRTFGVDIVYSDSARVKAKGTAPIMDKVTPVDGSPYQEMPKGIKIDFFNPKGEMDGTLTSDYAIRREQEQKTTFRKNVIVKNNQMDTFSSEELIWDEGKKIFYSNQRVTVRKVDGNVVEGMNFEAPQDFSTYRFGKGSGEAVLKEAIVP